MPHRREGHLHRPDARLAPWGQHAETCDCALGVSAGVQRQRRRVAGKAVPVGPARIFFLQMGAVEQQQLGQVAGGRGAVNRAFETLFDQRGQPAAVVQMGMAQHHSVDLRSRHRERGPVSFAQGLESLEHAAVQQDALAADGHQMARTGDGVGRAEEADFHVGPR